MAFKTKRDKDFELALIAYEANSTGQTGGFGTREILLYCAAEGIEALSKLDTFLRDHIGRGIEADDFCRIPTISSGEADRLMSTLASYEYTTTTFSNIISIIKMNGSVFSAEALLLGNDETIGANSNALSILDRVGGGGE